MEYKKLVESLTPKENRIKNMIVAFFSGGIIGIIANQLSLYFDTDWMLVFWIALSSVLTGLGVFDDLVDKFKMGIIIPITGFAHSIASSSIEYKKEGLITGIGSNYFKLAGSVVLYGIVSAFFLALLKVIIYG